MSMKLTLAIALECFPTECRVQLLDSDRPTTVPYSARVLANPLLVIRPGQLVALDTNLALPEVVYRWHYARVEGLKGDKVLIADRQGQLIELVRAEGLELAPQVNDWVFVTLGGSGAQSEVVDLATDGRPAHPAYFSKHVLPKVEQFYQRIADKA